MHFSEIQMRSANICLRWNTFLLDKILTVYWSNSQLVSWILFNFLSTHFDMFFTFYMSTAHTGGLWSSFPIQQGWILNWHWNGPNNLAIVDLNDTELANKLVSAKQLSVAPRNFGDLHYLTATECIQIQFFKVSKLESIWNYMHLQENVLWYPFQHIA